MSRLEKVALHILLAVLCLAILVLALALIWPAPVMADDGIVSLYWYGADSDCHLGRETAFASWWEPPSIPLLVRDDWHGVALNGLAPGAWVRITVVGVPEWGRGWLDEKLIGNFTLAVVADRPGGEYGDAWPATFSALTNGRLWIGKLQVKIEIVEQ